MHNEISNPSRKDRAVVGAFLAIAKTGYHLFGEAAMLLKEHGVSEPQYNVLRILRGAGSDGLPCGEIGARMLTRVPDVTRLVDRLRQMGYVRRWRSEQERRIVLQAILPKGVELLNRLDEPVLQLHRNQFGHMPERELRDLARLLRKVRHPE